MISFSFTVLLFTVVASSPFIDFTVFVTSILGKAFVITLSFTVATYPSGTVTSLNVYSIFLPSAVYFCSPSNVAVQLFPAFAFAVLTGVSLPLYAPITTSEGLFALSASSHFLVASTDLVIISYFNVFVIIVSPFVDLLYDA